MVYKKSTTKVFVHLAYFLSMLVDLAYFLSMLVKLAYFLSMLVKLAYFLSVQFIWGLYAGSRRNCKLDW